MLDVQKVTKVATRGRRTGLRKLFFLQAMVGRTMIGGHCRPIIHLGLCMLICDGFSLFAFFKPSLWQHGRIIAVCFIVRAAYIHPTARRTVRPSRARSGASIVDSNLAICSMLLALKLLPILAS